MATQASYIPRREYRKITISLPEIHIPLPRKDLLLSVAVLLMGLSIPLLMVLGIVELNFLTFFLGFILVAFGGVFWLIRMGEIG